MRLTIITSLLLASLFAAGAAQAQATRTWISGVGDDVNPCSRTAPCKTFAGAISKTAAGGEIDALDPGGFGSVTITKSITIDGGRGYASGILAASSAQGITINAATTDSITIRNLEIVGVGHSSSPAGNGISVIQAKAVHIEHCTIEYFGGDGIHVAATSLLLFIDDTSSNGHTGNGLNIMGSTLVRTAITGSHFSENTIGVFSGDNTKTTMQGSDANGNSQAGVVALGTAGQATVNVSDSAIVNNGVNGIVAGGTGATFSAVRISNVLIAADGVGLATGLNGTIFTFGNNHNTSGGVPGPVIAEQ